MKRTSLIGLFLLATTASIASANVVVAEGPVAVAAPTATIPTAAAIPPASVCPKAFQGFHLGGNIGYGIGKGTQKFSRFFPTGTGGFTTVRNFSTHTTVSGVDGGIGVGYTHRLCNWAIGIAFDANWAGSDGKFSESIPGVTPTDTITLKARLRNSLQLYARLGYTLREIAMPFIALGWDNSQWKQNFHENVGADPTATASTAAYTTVASKSKRYNGFMWKVGVDFLATQHVVLGVEYTGTIAQRKSLTKNYTNPQTGGLERITASFKPQYNKFALTAKIVY